MPPIKTIAVVPPSRGGARRAPSPAVPDDEGEPFVHTEPSRRVAAQPTHRYRIGERLRLTHGGSIVARVGSGCKVLALLPYEGRGPLLYRVRSEAEAFERVVAEGDLSRGEPA